MLLAAVAFVQATHYGSLMTPQFLDDAGFRISCDEHFLQSPTDCRITDKESGETLSNDEMGREEFGPFEGCWYMYDGIHMLPCTDAKSGS